MLKVTVGFFAYNHEMFVEEALVAALRQRGGPYELIIIDDASTDGTREIIERTLRQADLSRIEVRRHYRDRNAGLLNAVNEAMAMSRGDIFIVMAGDDISSPDRIERCSGIFSSQPEVMAVRGGYVKIDEHGRRFSAPQCADKVALCSYDTGPGLRIYGDSSPMGAAAAYRRALFDFFGPMQQGPHGEDNCYWIRALLLGKIYHDDSVHISWRQHSATISNFQADLHSPAWRTKHLAWMELHAGMSGQWLTDIRRAKSMGRLGFRRFLFLQLAARREDATWSLSASSLRPDGWSRWGRSACRMLALGRFSTVIRMLKTRLSAAKREQDWAFWFRMRSS